MTEAMPFLQKAILLSYAPRPFGLVVVAGAKEHVFFPYYPSARLFCTPAFGP